MITTRLITIVAVLTFAVTAATAENEPTLKEIMQGLRDSLVEMTDGLLLGEADRVSRAARVIAEHPPISEHDRPIIVETLGPEMPAFAHFDQLAHSFSVSIAEAATQGDLARAEREYQQMLGACFACHNAYKTRVAEALVGTTTKPD
jgi:cytochrome c553